MSLGHKEAKRLAARLKPLGFTPEVAGSGHIRWRHRDGGFFMTPASPTDWQNVERVVRSKVRRFFSGHPVR